MLAKQRSCSFHSHSRTHNAEGPVSPALHSYLHFDCGTSGPAGAAGVAGGAGGCPPCSWLSRPPLPLPSGAGAPGAVGALWPPCRIDVGFLFMPAKIDSIRLVTK